MLVLSRKKSESIVVTIAGERIEVTVVDVDCGRVRLGISAPRDWTIHRGEVQQRIDSDAAIARLADDGSPLAEVAR